MATKKFYAFVTPSAVGVANNWGRAASVVTGTKGAEHKSFETYLSAQEYVLSKLSEKDVNDFGLDKNQLFLNKIFVRKDDYIKEKEAHRA